MSYFVLQKWQDVYDMNKMNIYDMSYLFYKNDMSYLFFKMTGHLWYVVFALQNDRTSMICRLCSTKWQDIYDMSYLLYKNDRTSIICRICSSRFEVWLFYVEAPLLQTRVYTEYWNTLSHISRFTTPKQFLADIQKGPFWSHHFGKFLCRQAIPLVSSFLNGL
jgi:hypothetical protein